MSRLGITLNRIATRLKIDRKSALKYSGNYRLFRSIRSAFKKGKLINQVSKEQGCPESLIWAIALEGKTDQERFKALNWGLRTWDLWNWNDCDRRFGDDWPGRIPAQMIAHILYYFKKQSNNYDPDAISGLTKEKYLEFLENFFSLAHLTAKKSAQVAFINADWRDFQSTPAREELRGNSIMIDDYLSILNKSGWEHTHIFQAPLSSERFKANVVSAMQKKKIIGVTSRYVIMSKKKTGL